MRAATSVTMANLTIEGIERKALDTFEPKPRTFLRYVNDGFCVVKTTEVDRLLKHLNSVDEPIQFTVEREDKGSFPFWMYW